MSLPVYQQQLLLSSLVAFRTVAGPTLVCFLSSSTMNYYFVIISTDDTPTYELESLRPDAFKV